MSTLIINLLQTNAVIALIVGAFATYLVKWLATHDDHPWLQYEGWAIAAVKAAEKAIPDGNAGTKKLDYALKVFLDKYTALRGNAAVNDDNLAKISAWISTVHSALEESGVLHPAEGKQ